MSASAKQIAANRRNALFSTGPRTDEGKVVARLNSATHGLAGQHLVLRPDHEEAYAAYYADMLPELAPAGMIERDLARRIICDSWRLNRAAAVDINLLSNGKDEDRGSISFEFPGEDLALADARAFRADAKTFNLLSLYEQRLQRSLQKNLALLRAMQKERKAQHLSPQMLSSVGASAAARAPQPTEIPTPSPEIGFAYASASSAPPSPPAAAQNDSRNMGE